MKDDEILKLYSNCKAVVFIPFMEDFGIVPFEALSLGKPVIASNVGGYVQMIKRYEQVFSINEKVDRKEMVEEVYQSLKNFITSNIKPKKINLEYLNEKNFIKNMNKILDKKA